MAESVDIASVGQGQVALSTEGHPSTTGTLRYLGRLHHLGDAALSELPLNPLLDEILKRLQEALEIDTVAVLLLDESKARLEPRATRGIEAKARPVPVPVGRGFAGRVAAARAPIFVPDVARADVINPVLRAAGISSLLGVPLVAEGTLLGVLHVGSITPRTFTDEDAVLLQFAAARVAPAIERARMFDALERQREVSIALQHSLLPARLPDIPGVEIGVRYLPARGSVGGDWYDVIELRDDVIGFAIGDVAGHGIRAAALMGQLRTGLRAYALEAYSPGETLKLLNALLLTMPGDGIATVLYGTLDPATGIARMASAGHPPPVLISAEGARFVTMTSAPPIGVGHNRPFPETTVHLGRETLLLYTDGLVERRDETLDLGLSRLLQACAAELDPTALPRRLTAKLVPEGGASGDVAIVALRTATSATAEDYGQVGRIPKSPEPDPPRR